MLIVLCFPNMIDLPLNRRRSNNGDRVQLKMFKPRRSLALLKSQISLMPQSDCLIW